MRRLIIKSRRSVNKVADKLGGLQRLVAFSAGMVLLASMGNSAQAQTEWPSRTVRFIVPGLAGGAVDTMARLVAEQMSQNVKQPVIIENKPGASGLLGMTTVRDAPADGHTILITINSHLTEVPHLVPMPFHPVKEMTQVAEFIQTPLLLAAGPDTPPQIQTLKGLIAYAKAKPGTLSVSSYGTGTRSHLAGVMLNHEAGIDLMHVPYKGGPSVVTALLGGQVPLSIEAAPNLLPHIRSGKLKVLATLTPHRVPDLPDVPTMAELGFPDITLTGWQGAWLSSKTPPALANRIHDELAKAFTTPKIRKALEGKGYEFSPAKSVEAQNEEFRQAFEKTALIVKKFNIKPD